METGGTGWSARLSQFPKNTFGRGAGFQLQQKNQ
jgi:hypothetical protein